MEDLSLPFLYEKGITEASSVLLYECKRRISILSLFSSNEDMEELSTESLQYLSCPHHLANAIQSIKPASMKENPLWKVESIQRLKESLSLHNEFINSLSNYEDFLSREELSFLNTSTPSTPEKKRDRKILIRRLIQLTEQKLAADERQQEILTIKKRFYNSVLEIDMLNAEISILIYSMDGDNLSSYKMNNDKNTSANMANRRTPMKPFKLLPNTRQRDQVKVFGAASNSLPTMTIDQYLKEEKLKGGIIDGISSKTVSTSVETVEEMDDDDGDDGDVAEEEEEEEERRRLIRMDEFKDCVKRGSGNMYRRS